MINYTVEEIYNIYHHKIMYYTKKIHVRKIKNFDKIQSGNDWVWFQKFTDKVNKSCGQIDPKTYIDALIDFFKGRFNLAILCHLKGIKIYRLYIQQMNNSSNKEEINKKLVESFHFLAEYMEENNVINADSYLMINQDIYPILAQHFHSGRLSSYFLTMFPDIIIFIKNYPPDIRQQYFSDFIKEYKNLRTFVVQHPKLKKLSDNFEKILLKLRKELKK